MTDRAGRTGRRRPAERAAHRFRAPHPPAAEAAEPGARLLIVACVINAAAIVLVQLGAMGRIDTQLVLLGAGLSALVFGLHIAMRFVARDADPFLLPIATVLNGLGIAMIYRIDIADGDTAGRAPRCARSCGAPSRSSRRSRRSCSSATTACCSATPTCPGSSRSCCSCFRSCPGIGREVSGARVWIGIGDFATFQPGEIAKIALAVFFAGYLVRNRDSLSMVGRKFLGMQFPRARDLGPLLVVWALSMAVIVFQRDLGTALLYFGLFLVMLYVATSRLSWVVLGLSLFIGGAIIASQTLDYVNGRFANWLDPFNPERYDQEFGGSYQLVQGLFGLANGGLIGTGLGARAGPTSRRCRRATTSSPASARSSASPASSRSSPSTCCSSPAASASASPGRTTSASSSASGSRSSSRCRSSSSSAASPASSPSPASRPRSSRPAARRSSRTGSSSRCCCGSPTPSATIRGW